MGTPNGGAAASGAALVDGGGEPLQQQQQQHLLAAAAAPAPAVDLRRPAVVVAPPVPRNGVPSHWTPINVGRGADPMVELCQLDYDT
jgi:hypothetical protein